MSKVTKNVKKSKLIINSLEQYLKNISSNIVSTLKQIFLKLYILLFLVTVQPHGEKKESRAAKENRNYQEEEISEEEVLSEISDNYEESDTEMSDGGSEEQSETDEESGTDVEEAARREAALLKRKRKAVVRAATIKRAKKEEVKSTRAKPSTSKPSKGKSLKAKDVEKPKESEPEANQPKEDEKEGEEKGFDNTQLEEEDKGGKKSKKKEAPIFNDKNVDYNLYNDAPENVMARKIKISNTVMVTCKMIDAISGGANGLSYDYAALTFVRKIQNAKAFEFNLPLTLVPSIIEALKLIVKDNPRFFRKHHHAPME
jgi:hypothetical protein